MTTTDTASSPTARRWTAWVCVAQRCWQRVGTADTEAAALELGREHLRRRLLSGDCYALPVDGRPEQR